jgi:PHS family inorganic phosphate transporter-like MFS transporter
MDIYPPPPHTDVKGRGGSHYFLDERRRTALSELDNAKTSWFHVKVCLVAGVGFFTDAYDLFAINIGAQMLGYVYGHGTCDFRHHYASPQLGTPQALPASWV